VTERLPPRADRRAFLIARGWTRIGRDSWRHDRYGSNHFFSLAAAYLKERQA